ncbi:MAG: putative lipid II flippase FtsW, partial [Planctomycetes bacterium]|nr:putative lipid II flippase FtsW [Planctomycetota bacterium]
AARFIHYDASRAFFIKQAIWLGIGLAGMIVLMNVDYRIFSRPMVSRAILIVAILALVAVLVPGLGCKVNGARRWFRIGGWSFQPSELAKLAVIIFFSSYVAANQARIREFSRGFAIPIFIVGIIFGLIAKEPDFGSAVLISTAGVALLIVGGVRVSFVGFTVLAALPILYAMVFDVPYRRARWLAFLNPWEDPEKTGYHIIQSLIALGSGGIAGVGIGASRQKLFFLPEASNDFILAVIGEELGFLGAALVISLFMLFVYVGMRVCQRAPDLFGFLLSFGIVFTIGLQAAINAAVVTASVPTKGIPLPFISSGGSSLVSSLFAVGILLNIAGKARPAPQPASRQSPAVSPRSARAPAAAS